MDYIIIIPAHNEADYITLTLDSILTQDILPKKIIVVNDNSTDNTAKIVDNYTQKHNFISCIHNTSNAIHLPGSKVIKAFYAGLNQLDTSYDIIVKLDADMVLPPNYFKAIIKHFSSDKTIGIAGGVAYIQKNNEWVLEKLTNNDHVRGGFKAYRKECFTSIGGLKKAMGWDTADELSAQYHGWKILVDESLIAKHLKPTGKAYNKAARHKQGEAFYALRYRVILAFIASAKLAFLKKRPFLLIDYCVGYLKAWQKNTPYLLSKEEGVFSRKLRWRGIISKLF